MNIKRWAIASVAVFVVLFVLEFVIHGVLLQDIYRQTAPVWRPLEEMNRLMWWMWLGDAVIAVFFTLIYTQGYEKPKAGAAQGMRYGLYLGILMGASMSLGSYATLPIPGALALYWIIGSVVEFVAAGAVVGWIYRREA
jgi:hypothetical protein